MENKDLEKKKLKTLKVAEEIVDTEVQYVEKLNVLFINFYKHAKVLLEAKKEVMSEREIAEIFMNIEDIYKLNNNLCTKLVGLRYKGDEMFISGIIETLLTFTPFLKVFGRFWDD